MYTRICSIGYKTENNFKEWYLTFQQTVSVQVPHQVVPLALFSVL